MGTLMQDVLYAMRIFRRAPGFTLAAVITLTLGIGATTAVYSVVHGVVLRPLPYEDPDELVTVWKATPERGNRQVMSQPDLRSIQEEARSFESLAGINSGMNFTLTGMGEAELIPGVRVTDGLLEVFHSPPVLGRDIRTEENVPGGPRVVVIGYSFWQNRLGGDPEVIGRTIELDAIPYEIVGVAPPGFDYPGGTELWRPVYQDVEQCGRGCHMFDVIGRLASGVALEEAGQELLTIASRLEQAYPESNHEKSFEAVTLEDTIVGDVRTALFVLFAAVGFVLLIACANVANLLLAWAPVRTREVAVRAALGASRYRILRQLLVEMLVLSMIAGALGLLTARWGIDLLIGLAPESLPRIDEVTLNVTVLVFALAVTAIVSVLSGLAPAFRLASAPVSSPLNEGGRGGSGSVKSWTPSALLVVEVGLSLVLLFGTGLLLRSFHELRSVELGFNKESVLSFSLRLPPARYPERDDSVRFFDSLEERLRALPGVQEVSSSFGNSFEMDDWIYSSFILLDRPEPPPGQRDLANIRVVTPGYFDLLDIPVTRGRAFDLRDREGTVQVAVVSESFSRRFYPGGDPIGKQFLPWFLGYSIEEPLTIVGVVGDVRSRGLTDEPGPEIYLPQAQAGINRLAVLVRTSAAGIDVLPSIRAEVRELDPNLPLREVSMLEGSVDRAMGTPRFYLTLLFLFAAIALALAAIGLYGVVAFLVSRRTREIGVRMAMGADSGSVTRMILWQGLRPTVLGVALGIGGSYLVARFLGALLYNIEPHDPMILASVTGLLLVVVIAAILIPARRASKLSPVTALRTD